MKKQGFDPNDPEGQATYADDFEQNTSFTRNGNKLNYQTDQKGNKSMSPPPRTQRSLDSQSGTYTSTVWREKRHSIPISQQNHSPGASQTNFNPNRMNNNNIAILHASDQDLRSLNKIYSSTSNSKSQLPRVGPGPTFHERMMTSTSNLSIKPIQTGAIQDGPVYNNTHYDGPRNRNKTHMQGGQTKTQHGIDHSNERTLENSQYNGQSPLTYTQKQINTQFGIGIDRMAPFDFKQFMTQRKNRHQKKTQFDRYKESQKELQIRQDGMKMLKMSSRNNSFQKAGMFS